jgi:hypothetical protein
MQKERKKTANGAKTMLKNCSIILSIIILAASCAHTNTITLSPAQVANTTGTTQAPLDTLAAYRKMPGQPKTVWVNGYYRQDSTFIKGHYRSGRTTQ